MNYSDLPPDVLDRLQHWLDGVTKRKDGHLLFLLPLRRSGQPLSATCVHGRTVNVNARRFLWVQAGKPLSGGEILSPCCGEPACVDPAHARKMTRSDLSRRTAQRMTPARRVQLLKAAARKRKLDDQQQAELMAWDGGWKSAVEHFGICKTTYYEIRNANRSPLSADPMASMAAQLRRAA